MMKKKNKKKTKKKDSKKRGVLARTSDAVAAAVSDPVDALKAAAGAVTGGSAAVGALELGALGAGVLALLAARKGDGKDSDEPSPLLRRLWEIIDERILHVVGPTESRKTGGRGKTRTVAKTKARRATAARASGPASVNA